MHAVAFIKTVIYISSATEVIDNEILLWYLCYLCKAALHFISWRILKNLWIYVFIFIYFIYLFFTYLLLNYLMLEFVRLFFCFPFISSLDLEFRIHLWITGNHTWSCCETHHLKLKFKSFSMRSVNDSVMEMAYWLIMPPKSPSVSHISHLRNSFIPSLIWKIWKAKFENEAADLQVVPKFENEPAD